MENDLQKTSPIWRMYLLAMTAVFYCSLLAAGGLEDPARIEIRTVFEQLSPTPEPVYDLYSLETKLQLETRSFKDELIAPILQKFRAGDQKERKPDYGQPPSFFPGWEIKDLAENDDWRIVALVHLLPGDSQGVLMTQNKATKEWSTFYTIPADASKKQLYFPDMIKLSGNILSCSFCTNWETPEGEWGFFEISLEDYELKPAFQYRFSDYPVKAVYTGAIAPLQKNSHETAGMFQTRIRNSLSQGVNFAGHYVVTAAGCGSECQIYIITNAKTGCVLDTKGGRAGAQYLPDSRLLIINTEPYCMTTDICEPSYYLIEKNKLVTLE